MFCIRGWMVAAVAMALAVLTLVAGAAGAEENPCPAVGGTKLAYIEFNGIGQCRRPDGMSSIWVHQAWEEYGPDSSDHPGYAPDDPPPPRHTPPRVVRIHVNNGGRTWHHSTIDGEPQYAPVDADIVHNVETGSTAGNPPPPGHPDRQAYINNLRLWHYCLSGGGEMAVNSTGSLQCSGGR